MILITGATGLVGAHLALYLAERVPQLRALYRTENGIEKTKRLFEKHQKLRYFNTIEWVKGDITDIPSLENAFIGVTQVYHCAALISFDPKDEDILRKTNIEGTANIVNFCIDYRIEKLCYVSSIAALGDLKPSESMISETTEWNPEKHHSDYAISKYGAEMEIWRGQQEGLSTIIVNPGIILGDGFWNQGSGKIFKNVSKGFRYYTDGITACVGVQDVVSVMYQLMLSDFKNERFVLVSENLTFKEMVEKIAHELKQTRPLIEIPKWICYFFWRMEVLFSFILNTKRNLSYDIVQSLFCKDVYDNTKIKKQLHFQFSPISSVIESAIAQELSTIQEF